MLKVDERVHQENPGATGESAAVVSPLARDARYRPLVEWFIRGLGLRLDTMRQAQELGAWRDLVLLAHQLTEAAAAYGYPTIGGGAAELERAARERRGEGVEAMLARLQGQCEAAARGIEALPRV